MLNVFVTQDSLKVELSLSEARMESSRRKIEAEMQMEAELQVEKLICRRLYICVLVLVNVVHTN